MTANVTDPTPTPQITPLAPPWRELRYWQVLDSTQCEARRLRAAGENLRGLVIQTDCQTAGRGRLSHEWISEPGGLYVTAGLPLPCPRRIEAAGWLPFAGALACAETVESRLGLAVRLKWPNDVLVEGRKVGGLIGEIASDGSVFIGLGLNWLNRLPPGAFTASGRIEARDAGRFASHPAARLADFCTGLSIGERRSFLREWLERLASWQAAIAGGQDPAATLNIADLARRIEERLWRRGESVRLTRTERGAVEGRLLGLGAGGAAKVVLSTGEVVEVNCGWQALDGTGAMVGDTARHGAFEFDVTGSCGTPGKTG